MKALTTLKALALVLTAVPTLALAAQVDRWEGAGGAYTPDGQELGSYKVATSVTHVAADVSESVTTITMPDGSVKSYSMTIKSTGNKFSTDSSLGKGGGACYGDDICESYIDAGNGQAFATTIVEDADGSRRSLTIVLENGKAIKMLRDKVSRVK